MHIFSGLPSSNWSWVIVTILTHPSSTIHSMFPLPLALSQHLGDRDSLPGGVTYTFFSEEAQPLVVQPLLDCSGLTLTFFILSESPKCPVNTLGPRHLHCKSNPTFPCQLESVFSASRLRLAETRLKEASNLFFHLLVQWHEEPNVAKW